MSIKMINIKVAIENLQRRFYDLEESKNFDSFSTFEMAYFNYIEHEEGLRLVVERMVEEDRIDFNLKYHILSLFNGGFYFLDPGEFEDHNQKIYVPKFLEKDHGNLLSLNDLDFWNRNDRSKKSRLRSLNAAKRMTDYVDSKLWRASEDLSGDISDRHSPKSSSEGTFLLIKKFQSDLIEKLSDLSFAKLFFDTKSVAGPEPTGEFSNKKFKDKQRLKFDSETGDIQYKEEAGQTKNGRKDFALLKVLYGSKNTSFNISNIQQYCNPLVNKEAHKFRKEKDIDDTVRQIRFKLKARKDIVFPIQKKTARGEKIWIWMEK